MTTAGAAANPEDSFPDWAERAGRMSALLAAPALPFVEVGLLLDIPIATLNALRARGKGPPCFRLGRRLYVRQTDLRAWLDTMSESEAA